MKKFVIILSAVMMCWCIAVGQEDSLPQQEGQQIQPNDQQQDTQPPQQHRQPPQGSQNNQGQPKQPAVKVNSVKLNKKQITLGCNPATLLFTISPNNASKSVTWKSLSNNEIAKVENGKVSPVTAGTDAIIVTAQDGKTDTCFVTVLDVEGAAQTITTLNDSIDKLNDSINTLNETVKEKDTEIENLKEEKGYFLYGGIGLVVLLVGGVVFLFLLYRKQKKGKQEEGKQEKGKQEEGKQEKGKQEEGKQEKGKQEEGKQGEVKQEEVKQEEVKQEEEKQGEEKQEEVKQGEEKQEEEKKSEPSNLRYADFIDKGSDEFRNVSETAGAMANFVLEISGNGITATFKVRDEAINRVIARPSNLDGCIKNIKPGGTNFSQIKGKAIKQDDKWIVDSNNRLKITIS